MKYNIRKYTTEVIRKKSCFSVVAGFWVGQCVYLDRGHFTEIRNNLEKSLNLEQKLRLANKVDIMYIIPFGF